MSAQSAQSVQSVQKIVVAAFALLLSPLALAMKPQTYQVSGPVVAFNDTSITIQKPSGEQIVLERDAITRTDGGQLKIGDRVTVSYIMSADSIQISSKKSADASKPGESQFR